MFQKEVDDILQYVSLPHPTAVPAVATLADMLNFFDSFCIVVIATCGELVFSLTRILATQNIESIGITPPMI